MPGDTGAHTSAYTRIARLLPVLSVEAVPQFGVSKSADAAGRSTQQASLSPATKCCCCVAASVA